MRTPLLISLAVAALSVPAIAFAQSAPPPPGATTSTGVVGGAITGAVVGGPVGAVVGGIIGGSIGAAAEPPVEVRTYVMQEQIPSARVTENVVVGQPLASTVEVRPVPKYPQYGYAVVNDRRVIVEPKTRQVIKVYE
jgi:uncharacterized membrane protein